MRESYKTLYNNDERKYREKFVPLEDEIKGPRQLELRYWPHQCVRGHPKPRHAVIHVNFLYVYNRLSMTLIASTLAFALLPHYELRRSKFVIEIFHFPIQNYVSS